MVNYLADDLGIRHEIRRIRLEEGRRDDDWRTATGDDLDAIAAYYGLSRDGGTDDALRSKVEAALPKYGF